jgi:murein L,D-transpeptidase YafK
MHIAAFISYFPLFLSGLCLFAFTMQKSDFKQDQLKNKRVKNAYLNKENYLNTELQKKQLTLNNLHILLIGYKYEKKLDVYVKSKTDKTYKKFITYDFCVLSGELGPKRKEGDLQVPEGFYYINWFNPNSNFHLSFKINYPNASDKILSDKKHPGGEIFIHGNCVSIGCIPITDEKMDELYILALEATNNGQSKIPVYIFPTELNGPKYQALINTYADKPELLDFWNNLKEGYTLFMQNKTALTYTVNKQGKYVFNR